MIKVYIQINSKNKERELDVIICNRKDKSESFSSESALETAFASLIVENINRAKTISEAILKARIQVDQEGVENELKISKSHKSQST